MEITDHTGSNLSLVCYKMSENCNVVGEIKSFQKKNHLWKRHQMKNKKRERERDWSAVCSAVSQKVTPCLAWQGQLKPQVLVAPSSPLPCTNQVLARLNNELLRVTKKVTYAQKKVNKISNQLSKTSHLQWCDGHRAQCGRRASPPSCLQWWEGTTKVWFC